MLLGRILFSVIVVGGLSAPSWAEVGTGEGDMQRGSAYATAMCASCHSVTADETPSSNPAAKPFRSVKLADIPGEGAAGERLTAWFNTTHLNTTRVLKETQGDDIAAFIASIAK